MLYFQLGCSRAGFKIEGYYGHQKQSNRISAKIIDELAEFEVRVGLLYDKYAEIFPEISVQWLALAEAERVHSILLKSMHRLLDKGNLFFNLGKFSKEAMLPTPEITNLSSESQSVPSICDSGTCG